MYALPQYNQNVLIYLLNITPSILEKTAFLAIVLGQTTFGWTIFLQKYTNIYYINKYH